MIEVTMKIALECDRPFTRKWCRQRHVDPKHEEDTVVGFSVFEGDTVEDILDAAREEGWIIDRKFSPALCICPTCRRGEWRVQYTRDGGRRIVQGRNLRAGTRSRKSDAGRR